VKTYSPGRKLLQLQLNRIAPHTALDGSTSQSKKLRLKYNIKYEVYKVK